MSNKNWKWYIDNDDLMGCYERFQNAPANWKNHWWSTIEEIFHSSKKWVKEYVLDPIQRTIVKLVKKVKSVASALQLLQCKNVTIPSPSPYTSS